MNPIQEYYQQIVNGTTIVSKRVQKQYKRLTNDINKVGTYVYDETRAIRPIQFIEAFCRHSKGEWGGKSVKLELFQRAYLAALFGFIEVETGQRQYRESLFLCGRKNGKSTLLSGLALYMLMADRENGSEVYSIATKKDQARLVFDEAQNMVLQSPNLSSHIRKRKTDLYFGATMSKFQALGKNSDTLDGLNAHLIIVDELHGIKDRQLYEVMQQFQSARRQPMLIMITTAGTIRECIFDDMYSYACNIVDGHFQDDRFLPILYELDAREEWQEPSAWMKANPGLGAIKKLDDLERKVEKAKNSPKDLSGILTKDFNIRDTVSTAWLSFDDIHNPATFDLGQFRNQYAIGGADLSITTDLTCATLLMIDKATQERCVHQMYWIPADNLYKRGQQDKIPYDIWHQQGLLRTCIGNSIAYSDITAWFIEMLKVHGISAYWVYYDSYSARYWVDEMEYQGFNMIRCIQGAKTLSLPMQQLGADLQSKKVNYNRNPILEWCLTNTGIQTDRNGNIVPIKSQSAKQRIDGTASLLNAYVGLMEHYRDFIRT